MNRLVVVPKNIFKKENLIEVRCEKCRTLMYRVVNKSLNSISGIEIKCKKCGHLNIGGKYSSYPNKGV